MDTMFTAAEACPASQCSHQEQESLIGMPLAQVVRAFMDAEGWHKKLEVTEDRTVSCVTGLISVGNHSYEMTIEAHEQKQKLYVTFWTFYDVPPERMGAMARMLNRVNCNIGLGQLTCLEDDEDSPLRLKFGLSVAGSTLTPSQIDTLIALGAGTFDTYGELLAATALTNLPVEELWMEFLFDQEDGSGFSLGKGPRVLR